MAFCWGIPLLLVWGVAQVSLQDSLICTSPRIKQVPADAGSEMHPSAGRNPVIGIEVVFLCGSHFQVGPRGIFGAPNPFLRHTQVLKKNKKIKKSGRRSISSRTRWAWLPRAFSRTRRCWRWRRRSMVFQIGVPKLTNPPAPAWLLKMVV